MKRKIIIAVLCVLLCSFSIVSVISANAATFVTDSLWKLEIASDTEYYIEKYYGKDSNLTLPDQLDSRNVVKINSKAFSDAPVVSVLVPDTYTSIENYAFLNNKSLENISLPSTLGFLGSNAFGRCTSLKTVNFAEPTSLEVISASAFSGCTSLEDITLPYGVKTIYGNVFLNCNKLAKVVVPVTVESIDEDTFSNCPNVTMYVYANSYALQYAINNNIPYVSLGEYIEPTEPSTATEEISSSSENVTEGTDATEVTSSTSDIESSTSTDATEVTTATVTTEPYESTPATVVTSSTVEDESSSATDATEPQSSTSDVSSTAAGTSGALTTSSSASSSTEGTVVELLTYYIGDADLDYRITIKDATIIQKHVAKLLSLDDVALKLADTNNDTTVSVKDATQIQKFIAGFKDILYVGDEVKL